MADQETCIHEAITIKEATGHNKPENKGKRYKICLDCEKWIGWHESGTTTPEAPKGWHAEPISKVWPTADRGKGDWDKRSYRIERQHSQEMALRYLAIDPSKVTEKTPEEAQALIKRLTDWFHKDLDSSLMGQTTDLLD